MEIVLDDGGAGVVAHRTDAEGAFVDVQLIGFQQFGIALLRIDDLDRSV